MFWIFLLAINIFAYIIMWIDKFKSIYNWWRISEKTLWMLAIFGGVFGIWLAMYAPIFHKAGKKKFKIFIPMIGFFWIIIISWYLHGRG